MNNEKGVSEGAMYDISPFNYSKDVTDFLHLPKRLTLYDTTLRDGEQTPGVVFRKSEKVKIAEKLAEVGVQRIEVGFPAVSGEDLEAAKEITKLKLGPKIFTLSRLDKKDVDLALSAGVDGIACELPLSDIVLKYRFKKTREEVLAQATEVVSYAKEHGLYTTIEPLDSTRTSVEDFSQFTNSLVSDAKLDSVIIVDSYSSMHPVAMAFFVRKFKEKVKIPVELHCHNELGLATANALAGVGQGAEVVQVAVNGLGDKCGLPPLDEIALGSKFFLGLDTGIKHEKLYELSKLVEEASRVKLPLSKPISGEHAHAYESGLLVWALVVSPYPFAARSYLPELVGKKTKFLLGKKSGTTSIKKKLEEMNLKIENEESLRKITEEVKRMGAEKKSLVTDVEFLELAKRYVKTGE